MANVLSLSAGFLVLGEKIVSEYFYTKYIVFNLSLVKTQRMDTSHLQKNMYKKPCSCMVKLCPIHCKINKTFQVSNA